MTKKRFVAIGVEWTDGFIQDHEDDKDLFNANAVCDLLNELLEENEYYKSKYGSLEEGYLKLQRENGQLESDLDYFKAKNGSLETGMFNLERENEQLKQFKENVIKWVDSQMKFNVKNYIETEDYNFKSKNIDLHNFKVFIGIDSND